MPEARDRLSREDDVIAAYSRRRNSRTGDRNVGRGGSITFVLEDENEERQAPVTPFRWRGTAMVGTPGHIGVASGRGGTRSPIIGRNAQIIGRENISPVQGSGRGRTRVRGSPLPTWYPRRPLGDVTAVVRVIEGRERSRGGQGQETEGPILPGWLFREPSVSISGAQPELDTSMISPRPTILKRQCPPTIGKVPKILLNITQRSDGDSVCLTPQKKLLNDIDTVEKVVMEELRKLKRTPSAKKAEREKRVKTLMSMR